MRSLVVIGRTAGSLAAVALVTVVYWQFVPVNPTTVALLYLVVILAIATGWGIVVATTASVAAMLCFNFFFLPPTGTFTIADPQNWVALLAFLLTAITASQLSGRARQRELESPPRRGHDFERLYALSRIAAARRARRHRCAARLRATSPSVRAADGGPVRSRRRRRVVGRQAGTASPWNPGCARSRCGPIGA